ncbi:hypothetical protein [Brasilonema octagenarum]|jgi:hypothetical protein|uniref:Transposase n=1 Tax=Brasilonema octagenarum UFV-OR1 TaxID=417115 RepID=A0ABX1M064_9CYAN|nr:hypothetical protein [Brasilonema octagenarum]NMF61863.1 hypothetical protein [Brasilonema octagenarum UFV-OR1]
MFKSLFDKQLTAKISQNSIANQKGEIPVEKLLTGYLLNIRKGFRRNKHSKVSKFRKESTKLFKFTRVNYFCISLQQEIDTVLTCSLASKYIALAIILLYLFAD